MFSFKTSVASSKCLMLANAKRALSLRASLFSPSSCMRATPPPSCWMLLWINDFPASPKPRASKALIFVIAFSINYVSCYLCSVESPKKYLEHLLYLFASRCFSYNLVALVIIPSFEGSFFSNARGSFTRILTFSIILSIGVSTSLYASKLNTKDPITSIMQIKIVLPIESIALT